MAAARRYAQHSVTGCPAALAGYKAGYGGSGYPVTKYTRVVAPRESDVARDQPTPGTSLGPLQAPWTLAWAHLKKRGWPRWGRRDLVVSGHDLAWLARLLPHCFTRDTVSPTTVTRTHTAGGHTHSNKHRTLRYTAVQSTHSRHLSNVGTWLKLQVAGRRSCKQVLIRLQRRTGSCFLKFAVEVAEEEDLEVWS